MNERLRQFGLTPTKAALMAVLVVGLVAVWGPQLSGLFGGSAPEVASATRLPASAGMRTPRPATPPRPVRASAKEPVKAPAEEPPRSTIGLAVATSYDPFAPPAWSPQARQATAKAEAAPLENDELEARFASLRESGVAMILVSGTGKAIQIGDQTLRVGDRLGGFEVVEIESTGVVFRPAPAEGDDRGA